jgi:hypothetical protein
MLGSDARAHSEYSAEAWQHKSDARTYCGNRFSSAGKQF